MERPDLTHVTEEIRNYIHYLEGELLNLRSSGKSETAVKAPEPTEPPTPINVMTLTRRGVAKRTPRHFYGRQRRGGMGVFDLEASEEDPPHLLAVADENDAVLLFSNFGRAFRVPLSRMVETPVRGKGDPLTLPLQAHERIVASIPAAAPEHASAFVALVSQRGWVRRVKAGYFGKGLIQGMTFHDVKEGGHLTAVCWTPGDGDLFIATKNGKGIRFSEHHVSRRGCLGIRVAPGEETVAITAVRADSGVFMATNEGKGTIRLMNGFAANKAPGAGGKVAMKTDALIGATAVSETNDIFMISQLGKMIRFAAGEVPAKTGVVQGVNCMELRNDEALAFVAAHVA